MRSLYTLALAATFLLTATANAERIYRLVDYPELQNGYSLRGSITVSDDAPDDGVLDIDELIDWRWQATSSSQALSGSQSADPPPGVLVTALKDLRITDSSIKLSSTSDSELYLNDFQNFDQGPRIDLFLHWRSYFDASLGRQATTYSLRSPYRDSFVTYWSSQSSLQSEAWTLATAIPEPSAGLALGVAICILHCRPGAMPTERGHVTYHQGMATQA